MHSTRRRLLALLVGTPALLVALAVLYMLGMSHLEEDPRDFYDSVQWAAETLTTTGYGGDARWTHPVMIGFVVVTQFLSVALTFVIFSVIIVPYFERRFEGRLSRKAPRRGGYVLLYRYGAAVSSLLGELRRASVPAVVLEEDEAVARRLVARGHEVVFARIEEEDPDPDVFLKARAVVANGTDQQNAALILAARQVQYQGEIVALAEHPLHRKPMMLAGATAVYTPLHILAAAMAALASERINPRVAGVQRLGGHLHTAELRISPASSLAGRTLAESDIRRETGATIIGQWSGGEFSPHPPPHARLEPGAILVAIGSETALSRLGELATPLRGRGPLVVCGFGAVGSKVVELLRDAGETVSVLERRQLDGVDVCGDVLDQQVLQAAGVATARGVVLALGDDSTTLFSASVIRDFAPDLPIVARVNRADYVERVHRAGCDFVLSLSEVAAELLAQKMLGAEWISLEARVKLEKVSAKGLVGRSPARAQVGQIAGVSVVAVQRGEEIIVDFDHDFTINTNDAVYICGPEDAIRRYGDQFS